MITSHLPKVSSPVLSCAWIYFIKLTPLSTLSPRPSLQGEDRVLSVTFYLCLFSTQSGTNSFFYPIAALAPSALPRSSHQVPHPPQISFLPLSFVTLHLSLPFLCCNSKPLGSYHSSADTVINFQVYASSVGKSLAKPNHQLAHAVILEKTSALPSIT